MRENKRTLIRVVLCGAYVWLLEVGSYTIPVSPGAAFFVAVVISLLAVYELAIRDVHPLGMAAASSVIFAVILGGFSLFRVSQPLPPTGPLRPAGDSTPSITCRAKPKPGEVVMLLGGDTVIGQGNGPFTPFHVGDCPVLSLNGRQRA